MNYANVVIFPTILMVFFLVDCNKSSPPETSGADVEIVEIEEYHTLISYEEQKLSNPQILRYNENNSHLLVYDATEITILEFDRNGDVVNTYGQQGRGPGEFLGINNMFLADKRLYVVDRNQFRILRFRLDGDLDGSMNYGKGDPQALPPSPPTPLEPRAKNINNHPAVIGNGNVLLSNINPGDSSDTLYSLVDWGGDMISEMGYIPEGSAFKPNYNDYRISIENREIPAYYRPNTFPIEDQANDNEIFLVYSAFPKIVKYTTSGEKLWETDIPETVELDSITTDFYNHSENRLRMGPGRTALKKYVSGISGPSGHLYLILGKNYFSNPSNHLWIHEFNANGKLKTSNVTIRVLFTLAHLKENC